MMKPIKCAYNETMVVFFRDEKCEPQKRICNNQWEVMDLLHPDHKVEKIWLLEQNGNTTELTISFHEGRLQLNKEPKIIGIDTAVYPKYSNGLSVTPMEI